jgi:imidazolonepropionase-like amidohydrolase
VHLAYDGRPGEPLNPVDPIPVYAWRMANNAYATLRAGFTTVRDLGAPHALNCDLMRAVDSGLVEGPRIVAAGRMITMTGGHGWPIGREADGADEVRKAVREQLKAGARAIKLMASGGVMTPGVDPRSPQLGLDELSAGVEEAHKAGVKTASHAQAAAGSRNAVFAGIDSIEHGIYLEDDVIEEMRRRGTVLVATIAAPYNINLLGEGAGTPPHVLEKSRMVAEAHIDSFRRAMRSGVTLAAGTDAGTPGNHHGRNAQELRLMVEHGLTPAEALRAATANAAALLGLGERTGRVASGFAADLLLVAGDPLADVGVLERPEAIRGVWLEGRRAV